MSEPAEREDVPKLEWVSAFRVVTERPSRRLSDKSLDIVGGQLLGRRSSPGRFLSQFSSQRKLKKAGGRRSRPTSTQGELADGRDREGKTIQNTKKRS